MRKKTSRQPLHPNGQGVFWGVQYHPEVALGEIAVALRAQAADLVEASLSHTEEGVLFCADEIGALRRHSDSRALRWCLGVDLACQRALSFCSTADLDGRGWRWFTSSTILVSTT